MIDLKIDRYSNGEILLLPAQQIMYKVTKTNNIQSQIKDQRIHTKHDRHKIVNVIRFNIIYTLSGKRFDQF